jgi:hypothetical protein
VASASIALDLPDKLRFRLRRERSYDRFAKSLGIAREWQTGDCGFDANVFIVSEDWTLNEALSADRELRTICTLLLTSRYGAIECKAGRLYYDLHGSGSKDTSDKTVAAHLVRDWGATLLQLRERLQRISADRWQSARDPSLTRKAWLVGISVALGLAGFIGMFYSAGDIGRQVVQEAIPRYATWTTLAAISSLLAATFAWLRASPHTHGVLLDILLAALPGIFLATKGGLTIYNERCDPGAPRVEAVHVDQTYKRKNKNGTTYFLVVANWPDPRGERRTLIDASDFAWITPGACIGAVWHAGALGDGWVSGYRRACQIDSNVERP